VLYIRPRGSHEGVATKRAASARSAEVAAGQGVAPGVEVALAAGGYGAQVIVEDGDPGAGEGKPIGNVHAPGATELTSTTS
jgi:hypothetical protein